MLTQALFAIAHPQMRVDVVQATSIIIVFSMAAI